jgi:hypothetical protein
MPQTPEFDELVALGEKIQQAFVRIDLAVHEALTMLRDFDAREGWGRWGCKTVAHWLSWQTGMSLGTARERARVARALGELPHIDAAFASGAISYSKVRAVCRVATRETDRDLATLAEHTTGADLERICRAYKTCSDNVTGLPSVDTQLSSAPARPEAA